ncbi:Rap1a/Tai family immunity protein [Trinickia sp.]|uniref:Rap1a/Tai family immunity protein n=1 Tax=Trinickia sp. TaxID=2571163 RepID=UPI003F81EFA4
MLRALICVGTLTMPVAAMAVTSLGGGKFTAGDLHKLCSQTDAISRAACVAYITGAADGVFNTIDAIGGTTGPRVGQYFCLPERVESQRLVDAVRRYVAENRDAADYNASTAVSLGLEKAFPCKGD